MIIILRHPFFHWIGPARVSKAGRRLMVRDPKFNGPMPSAGNALAPGGRPKRPGKVKPGEPPGVAEWLLYGGQLILRSLAMVYIRSLFAPPHSTDHIYLLFTGDTEPTCHFFHDFFNPGHFGFLIIPETFLDD